jgi:hypothetical protein
MDRMEVAVTSTADVLRRMAVGVIVALAAIVLIMAVR